MKGTRVEGSTSKYSQSGMRRQRGSCEFYGRLGKLSAKQSKVGQVLKFYTQEETTLRQIDRERERR